MLTFTRAVVLAAAFALALPAGALAEVSFGGAKQYGAGDNPYDLAVADFNGDSDPDMAVANLLSNDVTVKPGGAGASFGAGATYPVSGVDPRSVAVGDFNADGDPDLVTANSASNDISVLLGQQGLGFAAPTKIGVGGTLPISVAVGNFNADSDPDLAVTNGNSNDVSILLGGAGGGFALQSTRPAAGTTPRSVAVGDFNRDNKSDLAVANQTSNDVSILLGAGDGTFGAKKDFATGGKRARSLAVGDFNADSDPDLAVASLSSDPSVLLGQAGGGDFGAATTVLTGLCSPMSVAVADFSGDGDPDLAFPNNCAGRIAVVEGGAGGSFGGPTIFSTPSDWGESIAVGDFNADSDPDLAVANSDDTVSVHVNRIHNDPPRDANDDIYTTWEDTPLSVPAKGVLSDDVDPEDDALSAVLESGPSHGSVTLNSDGSFVYTPNRNYPQNPNPDEWFDTFTYRASDGSLESDPITVFILIKPLPDRPVADDDAYATDEDTPLTIDAAGVLGNDSDGDGDSLTAALASDPEHGTVTFNQDGTFSYTPDADFNGTDSFSYLASDGAAADDATVEIEVDPVNDAPAAAADSYATAEDTTLELAAAAGVLSNDSDVEGDAFSAAVVSGPAHGSLELGGDGSLSYTPERDYNGSDSFSYEASDGELVSETVTVTIDVGPVNDAPDTAADAYATDEDTPLEVSAAEGVLANDSDVEGDAVAAAVNSHPAHGSLALARNGSLRYTPNADYNGTDSFTYRANDGELKSDTATVTIDIKPVDDAPVAQDDTYATDEDTALTIDAAGVLGNDPDGDGDNLTAAVASDPEHGDLTLNQDGTFRYTPDDNYNGPDSFRYRANDGVLDSGIATVTIDVKPVNDAPAAAADAYATDEDTPLEVAAAEGVLSNDSDVEGDAFSAVVASGPAHGSLALNPDGSLSYTPERDYNGSDSFEYGASDGADSGTATVTIEVRAVDDTPPADPAQPPAGASTPPAGPDQPSAVFTIGSVRYRNRSTVVTVVVPGPGTVAAQQVSASTARVSAAAKRKTFVKRTKKMATQAGPVTLTLKPTKAGMKLLRLKKKLTARIRFTFTPSGGTAKSTYKKITIKLKRR
jgi:VCBS repeat-containing protein